MIRAKQCEGASHVYILNTRSEAIRAGHVRGALRYLLHGLWLLTDVLHTAFRASVAVLAYSCKHGSTHKQCSCRRPWGLTCTTRSSRAPRARIAPSRLRLFPPPRRRKVRGKVRGKGGGKARGNGGGRAVETAVEKR